MLIFRDTEHTNTTKTTGAVRRTQQLFKLLEQTHAKVVDVVDYDNKNSNIKLASRWFNSIDFLLKSDYSSSRSSTTLGRVGDRLFSYKQHLAQQSPDLIIWEHTNFQVSPTIGKRHNIPVIACPHNIEALVTNGPRRSFEKQDAYQNLAAELQGYRDTNAVFTISRYDSWLLAQFGIDSNYLPYYPAPDIEAELLTIRQQRELQPQNHRIFVPGSAFYRPIYIGMLEILKALEPICIASGITVDIAGYGSEKLAKEFNCEQFVFHGSISNQKFQTLQANCMACLVQQQSGTGAITRIPEMLIAGIPVICNPMAARSAETYDGVHIYESTENLTQLLHNSLPMPSAPSKPAQAEQAFIHTVKKLGYNEDSV